MYRAQEVLNALSGSILFAELAVVHGRVGVQLCDLRAREYEAKTPSHSTQLHDHERALNVLVNDLGDFTGAENYCFQAKSALVARPSSPAAVDANVSHRRKSVEELFLHLLKVYLKISDQNLMRTRVLNLLKHHAADLDMARV